MAKINIEIKQKMLSLIQNGSSINSISKESGLYKSTIYYHYKKILGKKILEPYFYVSQSEAEGEIIGAFAADGGCVVNIGIYDVNFYIGGNEQDYCKKLVTLLNNYFHKKPYIYKTEHKNLIAIRYRSKTIYNFLKHYLTWNGKKVYSIKLQSLKLSPEFLKGFIRGYFDCDGYSYKDNRKVVMMGVSSEMLHQIYDIVQKLGFCPIYSVYKEKRKNMHDLHKVILKGLEAERFIQFISPNNCIRIRKWGCRDSNFRSF